MCVCVCVCVYFMAQQPTMDQGLLSIEASRSHSDTPHSVGLLWTSDQLDAETSLYLTTHNTLKRGTSMPLSEFEPTVAASERSQTHASCHAAPKLFAAIKIIHSFFSVDSYNWINQLSKTTIWWLDICCLLHRYQLHVSALMVIFRLTD